MKLSLKLTEKNRKWWVLFAVTSAISMIFVDITVLPVALPSIQRTLDISELGLQWIVNSYTLAITLFVLLSGRLADRIGYRVIFLSGLGLFTLGSVLCAMSWFEAWFVISRFIQGIGASLLLPTASVIVFQVFPAHQRGKALGLYVSISSVFLALGPFIGGVLSQYFSWRLVFIINVPIAIVGTLLTLYSVPKIPGKKKPFDLVGFLMLFVGVTCLVVPLMQVKEWGWTSPLFLGVGAVGAIVLTLLYTLKRKVDDPFFDFKLLRNRNYTGALLSILFTQITMMVTVFWAIYFQNVFGYTPSQAGAISLISNAPIMIAAPIGGHLFDKYGPRIPLTVGFCLMIGSLFWFLQNIDNRSLPIILSAIVPFGCSIPLILNPSFTNALAEVEFEKRGLASGKITMFRQLGGTVGLALLGSAFLTMQQGEFAKDLARNQSTETINVKDLEGLLSKAPDAMDVIKPLSAADQHYVVQSARNTTIHAFWGINLIAMLSAVAGLIASLLLIRRAHRPEIEL